MNQAFLQPRTYPLILAHRGASAYAPENTLAAFRLAAEMGAEGIELDGKLSRDGAVVVMHDATVDRTSDGEGRVSDLTLAELKQLDAGRTFDARFAGERIPTLDEVFDAIGDRLIVNVELTNYTTRGDGLEDRVVDLIVRRGLLERAMVSSFNPASLRRVKHIAPQVVCGLLYAPGVREALRRMVPRGSIRGLEAHHPHHSLIDARLIRYMRKRNLRVNTWTVNEADEMRRLIDLGVDAIMTDRPDVMRRLEAGDERLD
jgi:glycerophosphoryl diester phosphodiesterase